MEAVTGQLNTLDVRDEEEGTRATRLDTDAAEPSSPPSLATLPLELTRRILFWLQAIDTNPVFEYSHWDYSPSLGNLALVNRQFAELSHAVLYEYMELDDSPASAVFFTRTIAPRRGHHIRTLSCGLGSKGGRDPTRTEQVAMARHRALVASAIPHLVNLTGIIADLSDEDTHFDALRDPLAAVVAHFGPQLLRLDLSHTDPMDPSLDPVYVANLLRRLPNLTDLSLSDVAGGWSHELRQLADSVRSLQHLKTLAFDSCDGIDGSLASPAGVTNEADDWNPPLVMLSVLNCPHLSLVNLQHLTVRWQDTLEEIVFSTLHDSLIEAPKEGFALPGVTVLTLDCRPSLDVLRAFAGCHNLEVLKLNNWTRTEADDELFDELRALLDGWTELDEIVVGDERGGDWMCKMFWEDYCDDRELDLSIEELLD